MSPLERIPYDEQRGARLLVFSLEDERNAREDSSHRLEHAGLHGAVHVARIPGARIICAENTFEMDSSEEGGTNPHPYPREITFYAGYSREQNRTDRSTPRDAHLAVVKEKKRKIIKCFPARM